MIIVNGEELEIDSGSSVAKLVKERGLDRSRDYYIYALSLIHI